MTGYLSILWLLPLGIVVGALGTLVGAGGGFLLTPILLLAYPHESPGALTGISLAAVLINALSATRSFTRMHRIDYRSGLLFASFTVPGAVLGAMLTGVLPRRSFDLVFGGFLLAVSAYMISRPSRTCRCDAVRCLPDCHLVRPRRHALGIALSVCVGFVSGLLGIGGGILHVPVMVSALGFPVRVATATSTLIIVIMTAASLGVRVASGALHHEAPRILVLAAGVLIGSPIGASVSNRLHGDWTMRVMAVALALAGWRVLVAGL